MNFIELAWGAFIYRALGSDKDYLQIMSDEGLLSRLRTRPSDVTPEEFNKKVKLFLSQWRCRVSNKVGNQILRFICTRHKLFVALDGSTLESLNEEEIQCAGKTYSEMRNTHGVGPAICAKTLHVLNPDVFMPWDNPILKELNLRTRGEISDSRQGYSAFLRRARIDASDVMSDFRLRGIDGSANDFLSERLGYDRGKSMAKFLDEYYWVTLTNKFEIPPSWNSHMLEQ
jgi:hypothetical protein